MRFASQLWFCGLFSIVGAVSLLFLILFTWFLCCCVMLGWAVWLSWFGVWCDGLICFCVVYAFELGFPDGLVGLQSCLRLWVCFA